MGRGAAPSETPFSLSKILVVSSKVSGPPPAVEDDSRDEGRLGEPAGHMRRALGDSESCGPRGIGPAGGVLGPHAA